jgi:hypothetical protein
MFSKRIRNWAKGFAVEEGQERDHVARPTLPWRTDRHTQCDRAADDVASVISVDELEARIQRDGHERTVETTCRTCWDTSRDAARWETNPIGVVAREAVRASIGSRDPSSRPEAVRFAGELRAALSS